MSGGTMFGSYKGARERVPSEDVVVRIKDEDGYGPAEIDAMTNAIVVIDYAHHMIHEGKHFKAGYTDVTLNTSDTVVLVFTTPNSSTWMHWTMTAQSTDLATVVLYKDPTLLAEGTLVDCINRNQNSSNISAMTVRHTPTISSNGTSLARKWLGGEGFKTTIGGELRGDSEFILEANTQYMIVLTAGADSMQASVGGDWYEQISEN